MALLQRASLVWFLVWSAAVVLVTSAAANSQVNPLPIEDELAREIENLDVIHQLNAGALDASRVALQADSELENSLPTAADSRRSPQRSILSRR